MVRQQALGRVGETRMSGSPAKIREIFEHMSDAPSRTTADVRSYMKEHPDFGEVGERMCEVWQKDRKHSLQ
jgi:hypothetical protein